MPMTVYVEFSLGLGSVFGCMKCVLCWYFKSMDSSGSSGLALLFCIGSFVMLLEASDWVLTF